MSIHKLIKILQTFLGEPHSKQLQAFSVSGFLAVTHFFFPKKKGWALLIFSCTRTLALSRSQI